MSSAGDQNHDGYDDVLVGAEGANAAYVFSGRTYELLRRYDGAPGAGLGSGADRAGRHRLIVGALTEGGTGGAHVFSGSRELFSLAPPPGASRFGQFFVPASARPTSTSATTTRRAATGSPACTPAVTAP